MKRAMVALLLLSLACAPAFAQQQAAPKPGPEHKRLSYFVGAWTGEADMKKNDMGLPAGKGTMTEKCELFPGGYFVVCRSEGTGPMGEMKGLSILGYDAKKKVYGYTAISNMMPNADTAQGTYSAGTWTWTGESEFQGKMVKSRFIMKEESPTSYSFKWESASGVAPMTLIMDGKMTKSAGKPAAKKVTQQ